MEYQHHKKKNPTSVDLSTYINITSNSERAARRRFTKTDLQVAGLSPTDEALLR